MSKGLFCSLEAQGSIIASAFIFGILLLLQDILVTKHIDSSIFFPAFMSQKIVHLTHLFLVPHLRDIGKQCRPRSDAAELGQVVQSIVSLTNSLMTDSLTVEPEVFSSTLIFLLQKAAHIFSA